MIDLKYTSSDSLLRIDINRECLRLPDREEASFAPQDTFHAYTVSASEKFTRPHYLYRLRTANTPYINPSVNI